MSERVVRKTPLWAKILLILVVAAVAGGAGLFAGTFVGARAEIDTQVVRSIKLEQKVILLTAGMTEIKEERENQDFFGLFDIPGTERAMFVRYEFDAKFGIDGEDVEITRTGDNAYRITIPEFIYLGYDNPDFTVATEANGLLSWTTPEIDKFEMVEGVLTDEAVSKHLEGFRPMLEEQAHAFYSNIVTSINPAATIEFAYTGSPSKD